MSETHNQSMSDTLSPEDLYNLRRPTEVAVSPDGTRVTFVVVESDPNEDEFRRTLYVAPTEGDRSPHRLTRVADAGSPKWGPTGDRLAFVAARNQDVALEVGSDAEDSGDEDDAENAGKSADDKPKPQVWVYDLALGGDARQVTEFDEGVRDFDWSPDGTSFVVSARDPTDDQQAYLDGIRDEGAPYEVSRLQHKQDGSGFLDDVTTCLFIVDSDAPGASRDTATRLEDAYGRGAREPFLGLQPSWGPTDRIAYVAYYGENPDETYVLDVHTIAPDGSGHRTLTDGDVTAQGLRWSPDGQRLSYSVRDPTNFYRPKEIHIADPEAGETRSVSASLDRTVGWGGSAGWIGEGSLLAPIGDEARTRLVRLDASEDAPERVFDTQGTGRTIMGFDATPNTTAFVLSHPNEGHDVFSLPTREIDAGVEPTQLSGLNDDLLSDVALPECERIRFENSDGVEVEGLVYLPETFNSDTTDPLPLICHIHGGPTTYDAPRFVFDYAYWTGQGYAVLNVNYRGSTSYGRSFSERIRGEWGPREADDIVSGVDHVVDRGWADPERLFVSGSSQGGINTLYVVVRDDRFAAAAPEHGIYDFYSNFGTTDMHQWYVNDVGVPWNNEQAYREMSSITDINLIETPLLISAGENDCRTPPSQAEQLHVSAKRVGIESKLLIYQDEHHDISRPDRAIHRLEALTDWFETHGPDREEKSDKE